MNQPNYKYQEYSGLINGSNEYISIYNADFNVIDCSETFLKLFDETREEVLGKNIVEFSPEIEKSGRLGEYRKVLETGRPYYVRDKVTLDLGIRYFEIRAYRIETSLALVTTDVTEMQKAMEALKKNEMVDVIIRNSVDYFTLVDTKGIILFSDKVMPGYTMEQVIGTPIYDFQDKEGNKVMRRCFEQVMKTKKFDKYEIYFKSPQGKILSFETTVAPVIQNYRVTSLALNTRETTKRRRAEEELKKAKVSYEALLFQTNTVVFQQDKELRYTYLYNPHSGFQKEEVLGKTEQEVFHLNEDDAKVLTEIKQSVLKDSKERREDVQTTIKGEVYYYDLIVQPTSDAKGNISGIHCASMDITDRKKTELKLKENERRLKQAEKIAHLGYYEIDLPTGIINWSEETFRIFGLAPEKGEPTVEEYGKFIHESDSEQIHYEFGKSIMECSSFDQIYRIVRSDGEIRHLHGLANVEKNIKGEAVKLFGTVQDITQQKLSENKLRESESRLKVAQKFAHLGYYDFDVASRKIKWGEETFRIFGMDPEKGEPTLQEYGSLIHEEDREQAYFKFEKSIEGDIPLYQVYRIVRSDGEIRYLESLATVEKNLQGEPIKMFGTIQDITELKKAEADLRNAIIDGQEQERQRIAADLHDAINPLLSTAKLNVELLAEKYETLDTSAKSNFNNVIVLLERSMNDIKAISANLIPAVLKDFGLLQALNDLCKKISQGETLEVNFDTHGLKKRLDSKSELTLFRIVQELLNNIIKHAWASKVEVQLVQHKKSLVLMVTDDGKGLDQPFDKLQKKGLGFRNIKSRVQSLNGKMEVDSVKKKGTTMTVELPYING